MEKVQDISYKNTDDGKICVYKVDDTSSEKKQLYELNCNKENGELVYELADKTRIYNRLCKVSNSIKEGFGKEGTKSLLLFSPFILLAFNGICKEFSIPTAIAFVGPAITIGAATRIIVKTVIANKKKSETIKQEIDTIYKAIEKAVENEKKESNIKNSEEKNETSEKKYEFKNAKNASDANDQEIIDYETNKNKESRKKK